MKRMSHIITPLLLCCTTMAQSANTAPPPTPAPAAAKVYIVSPADKAVLRSPVKVVFGLSNMGVAPAGIAHKNTGHHHLLVDTAAPPLDKPIPADDKHLHFGGGQTETELELPPGEHSLQLLLGDALHKPHQPPLLSERITITVK